MSYPVPRELTYLRRGFSKTHGGVDLTPNKSGERLPFYAVGAGTVVGINMGTGAAGLNVMIRLDSDGSRWWYGHLSRIDVKVGQRVTDGQQMGLIGTTGNSTGVHLHLERHWPYIDNETDPWPFIKNEPSEGGLSMAEIKEIIERLDRIEKAQNRIEVATGIHTWALTDNAAGLRRMVQNVLNALARAPK